MAKKIATYIQKENEKGFGALQNTSPATTLLRSIPSPVIADIHRTATRIAVA